MSPPSPAPNATSIGTLPDDPGTHWSGGRDWFDLRRSPCGFDAPLSIGALVVTTVAVDACRGVGDSVEVRTAAEAATALAGQASTSVTGRIDLTIDGKPAIRLEISPVAGLETTTCDEGAALLLGQTAEDPFMRIDWTYTVYLIDIEGSIVAIVPVLDGVESAEDPGLLAEVDAIIGSLEIRAPGGPGS